jgi:hypothetical protein
LDCIEGEVYVFNEFEFYVGGEEGAFDSFEQVLCVLVRSFGIFVLVLVEEGHEGVGEHVEEGVGVRGEAAHVVGEGDHFLHEELSGRGGWGEEGALEEVDLGVLGLLGEF